MVEETAIRVQINAAKLAGQGIFGILQAVASMLQARQYGQQSIQSLNRQSQALASVELNDKTLPYVRRQLKEYSVDFAITKDKDTGQLNLWFKGQDVDRIQTAIAERRKIAFRYFDYSPVKERVHRNGVKVYSVSPYALLWNNDSYYLVGFHEHRQRIAKFRVDRIDGLRITQKAAVQKPKDFDVSAYFTQEFSMLTGKTCHITLLCENALMNSIIDRFGEDVPSQVVDDNHFSVEATVNLSSNFYGWVFASAGKMRIVEPQEAVEGFRRMLENFSER